MSNYFRDHGTKILGVLVALVGAAGESLTLIQGMDPKRAALWALVIGVAGAVFKRGFTNQATTDAAMLAKGWTAPAPTASAAPGPSP